MKKISYPFSVLLALGVCVLFFFQNCGQPGSIDAVAPGGNSSLDVCSGVSCELTPLTDKPAVTTILLALGDEADQQLVVNGASSQLVAETVIRFSSPVESPKILVVRDRNNNGEDPEDTQYLVNVLLRRYTTTYLEEPLNGLTAQDVAGFDVVWLNNPGHPMGSQITLQTLLAFPGTVVLQGDDLTRGNGFSTESLTGLRHVNNGTSVICAGTTYQIDNNAGEQFNVSLNHALFPQANMSNLEFSYGNDIDQSDVVRPNLEVMAVAKAKPASCTETRPAIVRYLK